MMSKEKRIKEMAEIIGESLLSVLGVRLNDDILARLAEHPCTAGYRKQSEGEWTRFEVNSSKGYGQIYYQHKDCEKNATQLFPSPYCFCPNCGAKMKGGAE